MAPAPLSAQAIECEFGPIECCANMIVRTGFSPHRHDTYTIALTTAGVQSFNYRGALWHSRPGQVLILHPDEMHDGYPSDEAGFAYHVAHVPPMHIQTVLGCGPLPFVSEGVSAEPSLRTAAKRVLVCANGTDGDYEDALFDLANAMASVSGDPVRNGRPDAGAVALARSYLDEAPSGSAHLRRLETITGCDRWKLSRDFRALLGTSPHRYLLNRRVDYAKALLRDGASLAAAAYGAGFADQSHFVRIFKRAVGMTPGIWCKSQLFCTNIL